MNIVTAVFLSMSLSLSVSAKEIEGLFGFQLKGNVLNYVSESFLETNKSKHQESFDNYFDLHITDKISNKNPYFNNYWLSVDNNNKVHEISANKSSVNLEVCLSQIESLKDSFINKYQSSFEYSEGNFSDFKTYRNSLRTDNNNNYLSLQCHLDYSNNSVNSQIILRTRKMGEAITDFYNSGI
jgi:hypothetical protein